MTVPDPHGTGYDVVVVGRGIVGVSAAHRAAAAGARVAVFDSGVPGQATAAGAGIVSPVGLSAEGTSETWTSLVGSAIAHYHHLPEILSEAGVGDAGFAQVGELVLAATEADLRALDALAARLEVLSGNGIALGRVERVERHDLTRSWPELRTDLTGLFIENAARVDGRLTCSALADTARLHGAEFVDGHVSLRVRPERRSTILVNGSPVRTGTVVVATGAWAQPMLRELGVPLEVRPMRGQIVHLHVASPRTEHRPVVNTFEGHYFLGFPNRRVVTGATHEPEAGFNHAVTAEGLLSVLVRALRIAPGLGSGTVMETRVGFRPLSSDGYPIVGRPAAVDDVVLATGLGAWGLTLGPLLGEVAAELALGLSTSIDAGFLGPERRPIDSRPAGPRAPSR
jgi:D-amino-acid dehydrogenase